MTSTQSRTTDVIVETGDVTSEGTLVLPTGASALVVPFKRHLKRVVVG